jgi:hypothetical protein
MSSYAEMCFWDPKKEKEQLWVDMGVKTSVLYADFKMGQFTFVASSYKKLMPKKITSP